jgi:threonine dehydrogenase-like Zn-dependent dehydrogenase
MRRGLAGVYVRMRRVRSADAAAQPPPSSGRRAARPRPSIARRNGAFPVPDEVSDEQAVFISDAVPAGFMAADNCNIQSGDIVAVWGCGGVGLMAMISARVLGAIDRLPNRLQLARDRIAAETIDFDKTDVLEALREMTGGRGPDACIDALFPVSTRYGSDGL